MKNVTWFELAQIIGVFFWARQIFWLTVASENGRCSVTLIELKEVKIKSNCVRRCFYYSLVINNTERDVSKKYITDYWRVIYSESIDI
jgi:hypothetical protein